MNDDTTKQPPVTWEVPQIDGLPPVWTNAAYAIDGKWKIVKIVEYILPTSEEFPVDLSPDTRYVRVGTGPYWTWPCKLSDLVLLEVGKQEAGWPAPVANIDALYMEHYRERFGIDAGRFAAACRDWLFEHKFGGAE